MTIKRGAHTTVAGNGLQNELMIGRVSVLGNLGKGKSINDPELTPERDLLSGTRLSDEKRRAKNHQNMNQRRQNWGYHAREVLCRVGYQSPRDTPECILGMDWCVEPKNEL